MIAPSDKNNFGVIRFILAINVLISHFFILQGNARVVTIGSSEASVDIGTISVGGFFAISGYLLTKSAGSQTTRKYMLNRIFRIFPAYWCVLGMSAAILFTLNSRFLNVVSANYAIPETRFLTYVINNLGLWQLDKEIYGLFPNNSYPNLINGSLWSLFPEFLCYISLIVGVKCCSLFKLRADVFVFIIIGVSIILGTVLQLSDQVQIYLDGLFPQRKIEVFRLLSALQSFSVGSLLALSPRLYDLSKKMKLAALFIFLFALLTFNSAYFLLASVYFSIIVIVIGSSNQKIRFFRWFDKFDFSYGIYLYHVPILQVLISFNLYRLEIFPPILMFSILIFLTFSFAIFSWFAIESPSKRMARNINKKFAF